MPVARALGLGLGLRHQRVGLVLLDHALLHQQADQVTVAFSDGAGAACAGSATAPAAARPARRPVG